MQADAADESLNVPGLQLEQVVEAKVSLKVPASQLEHVVERDVLL